ncbi:hypothetical protein TraAM80_02519 [Trypanosoma rangeli]|uniref:Uncharacterized protein n=1 Tax=Trypanosoma rangeli TaxID=5698 RepID=A0A422NUE9_TRYRA|nr:uncharacterized protein TraAM80_02519 [Trypanosoma rangeli]RNF09087.1 hypothetical protein TraAM80_02519 [Trypanosoma rangeli]|eukprot:RNF09087.1 hypothetical protein TraAM80_02519 [Trypanosoma rangeli]
MQVQEASAIRAPILNGMPSQQPPRYVPRTNNIAQYIFSYLRHFTVEFVMGVSFASYYAITCFVRGMIGYGFYRSTEVCHGIPIVVLVPVALRSMHFPRCYIGITATQRIRQTDRTTRRAGRCYVQWELYAHVEEFYKDADTHALYSSSQTHTNNDNGGGGVKEGANGASAGGAACGPILLFHGVALHRSDVAYA